MFIATLPRIRTKVGPTVLRTRRLRPLTSSATNRPRMQLVQHVLPTSALILSPGALSGPPMFNWHLTPARRAGRGYAVLPNHDKPASLPPAPPTATPVAYGTWLDRFPAGARPYLFLLRLDKPVGTWLLYWPCAWSILMAAYHQQAALGTTVGMLALFGTGALIMRGAGCVINDMWDKDIDARVERTTTRPIAAGIISRRAALVFLGAQLTGGLAVLTQLNWYSIGLGMASMPFVIVYPLMKRITYWPQFVLGLAFNWGALLGWAALAGETHWAVTLPLYAAGVSWTLVYDTIYAHQDKRDDRLVGTRSTALLFGDRSRTVLSLLSAQTVALLCLAGYANDHGLIYYLTTVVGAGGHLAWQLTTVDFDNTRDCWRKFESNVWLGALIAGGIGGDYLYRRYRTDADGNRLVTRVEGDSLSATAEKRAE